MKRKPGEDASARDVVGWRNGDKAHYYIRQKMIKDDPPNPPSVARFEA